MRTILLTAAVALTACNPCSSRITLVSDGPEDFSAKYSCEALEHIENSMTSALFWIPASRLDGYTVHVYPESMEQDPWGRYSDGFAICANKALYVRDMADRGPEKTALPHELGHAMENCDPGAAPCDKGRDADHCHWTSSGIGPAIGITMGETGL